MEICKIDKKMAEMALANLNGITVRGNSDVKAIAWIVCLLENAVENAVTEEDNG